MMVMYPRCGLLRAVNSVSKVWSVWRSSRPVTRVAPRLDLHQHVRQVAVRSGAGDQRDVGRALEDLLAFLLGDAAENGEALPFLVQLLEVVEAVEDLLLGLIANGAGVVHDEVGVLFALDLLVALGDERADDFFGVVEIHLATKGLDVEGLLLGTHGHPSLVQVYREEERRIAFRYHGFTRMNTDELRIKTEIE